MIPTLMQKVDVICSGRLQGLHLGVPITLVMDHARDQKCKIVRQLASVLGIELLLSSNLLPELEPD